MAITIWKWTMAVLVTGNIGVIFLYVNLYGLTISSRSDYKLLKRFYMEEATPLCPETPPGLVGPIEVINVSTEANISLGMDHVVQKLTRLYNFSSGGHYTPPCASHNRTAIVVPYRNRTKDLERFLINIVPFLIKQQTDFSIFLIEPVSRLKFNRALLMNIGFMESLNITNTTCFIFHDVDLVPWNDNNLYRCHTKYALHFSTAIRTHNYTLPYRANCGGVLGIPKSTYEDINGMSNLYFGWGGEDDDINIRLKRKKYKKIRYSPEKEIGRYYAEEHGRDKGNEKNPIRVELYHSTKRNVSFAQTDGLNTLKYKVVKRENRLVYTWVLIDLDMDYYEILNATMRFILAMDNVSTVYLNLLHFSKLLEERLQLVRLGKPHKEPNVMLQYDAQNKSQPVK